MNDRPTQLVAHATRFFSAHDEAAFFEWLDKLKCVADYHGEGRNLLIRLKDEPVDDASLRELLALFSRYNIEMSQLAAFETDLNRAWFRASNTYWHATVFKQTGKRRS